MPRRVRSTSPGERQARDRDDMSEPGAHEAVSDAAQGHAPQGVGLGQAQRGSAPARRPRRIPRRSRHPRHCSTSTSSAARSRMRGCAASRCRGASRHVFSAADFALAKPIIAFSAAAGFQNVRLSPAGPRQGALRRRHRRACAWPDPRRGRRHRASVRRRLRRAASVWDIDAALAAGCAADPRRTGPTTSFVETRIETGDLEAVARRRRCGRQTLRMGRHAGVPLEGRGVLAYYDRRLDELVVYSSTQFPHVVRTILAQASASPKASCAWSRRTSAAASASRTTSIRKSWRLRRWR